MKEIKIVQPGITDQVLAISKLRKVPIRMLSIGPDAGEDGHIVTVVRLEVAGLPFEVNLGGTWEERDKAFGVLLTGFVGLLESVQGRAMLC